MVSCRKEPRRRRDRRLRCGRAAALVLAAGALLGCAAPAADDPYHYALEQIRTRYVEPLGEERLQSYSLKGILTRLDPHSDYLDEPEYRALINQTRGEYSGIGALLAADGNRLAVVAVQPGAPAARAGLRPGDIIGAIDGRPLEAPPSGSSTRRLQGPAGTAVTLTIARDGAAPFPVTITRAVIVERSVAGRLEPDRVGYVRIAAFAGPTEAELRATLVQLARDAGGQLAGVVLDLRGNPGGVLESAVAVAADFLDGGTIVTMRGRDPADDVAYAAGPGGDLTRGAPLVVLIDAGSASAAEIVAGALQDHARAVLIGSRSFGKGSIQAVIPLAGGGAIRLTIARYYTPSGRSIQAAGIEPDVQVISPAEAIFPVLRAAHEADLPNALVNSGPIERGTLRAGSHQDRRIAGFDVARVASATGGDRQLAAALALLRQPR